MKVRVLKTFEGAYQGLVRPVNSREAEQLGQGTPRGKKPPQHAGLKAQDLGFKV